MRTLVRCHQGGAEAHGSGPRGALIKRGGRDALWPNFLALLAFTVALVSLSVWRFRRQVD